MLRKNENDPQRENGHFKKKKKRKKKKKCFLERILLAIIRQSTVRQLSINMMHIDPENPAPKSESGISLGNKAVVPPDDTARLVDGVLSQPNVGDDEEEKYCMNIR